MNASKRLTILTQLEYEELYALPKFTKDDRPYFFAMNDTEKSYLNRLSNPSFKAYFLLQLGYFRAKNKFFKIDVSKPSHDLRYLRHHVIQSVDFDGKAPSRNSQAKYREKILEFTGFSEVDEKISRAIKRFSGESCRRNFKPRSILSEVLDFLRNKKIELPEYSFLCDLIGSVIEREQNKLRKTIRSELTKETEMIFTNFLNSSDDYSFSLVKREAKSLRYKEVCGEITRHGAMKDVFPLATKIISEFKISSQNVKYLASLASHYQLSSLKSMPDGFSSVIVCCYIYFRFQESTDTLVEAFQKYISNLKNDASEFSKAELYKQRKILAVDTESVAKILDFYTDEGISEVQTFAEIKKQAFEILSEDEIKQFSKFLRKDFITTDTLKWNYYSSKFLSLKKNLRPILKALNLYCCTENDDLIDAIEVFKLNLKKPESSSVENRFPDEFIPNRLKSYVLEAEGTDPIKYECMLYLQISRRIEAKDIFVRNSRKYLSLNEDLISDKKWDARLDYFETSPYPLLSKEPSQILDDLEERLEERIIDVNSSIESGQNIGIVVDQSNKAKKWKLPYKKRELGGNDGIFDFLKPVNICDVISYVHQKTEFLNCFEHIQPRFSKSPFDFKAISACVVASGSNLGLQKMSDIANIDIQKLTTTYSNHFHLDSIRNASKQIINDAAKLPAYKYFDIRNPDIVHAAADGQKFATKRKNQMARHSPKYFHTGVGVVAYSLNANFFPINALTIGAHDHESHFLFDLVFNNKTDIDPDIISTDMHGVNHVNFALFYMFGRQFAPRYTKLQNKFSDLRGFNELDTYKDLFIEPKKTINRKLIESEWENISKILLSLALKDNSQAIIIRKLSSHKFSDKTKQALWELDSVVKSIYLLDYLDSEHLRQDVCMAQNRAESYHQLKRTIANIAGGKIRGSNESEIGIASECTRLLTNCIIFYNTDILSRALEKGGNTEEIIAALSKISPIAWRHINFLGRYEFRDADYRLDIENLILNLDLEKFLQIA